MTIKEIIESKKVEEINIDSKYKIISIIAIIISLIISIVFTFSNFIVLEWINNIFNAIAKLLGMIIGLF